MPGIYFWRKRSSKWNAVISKICYISSTMKAKKMRYAPLFSLLLFFLAIHAKQKVLLHCHFFARESPLNSGRYGAATSGSTIRRSGCNKFDFWRIFVIATWYIYCFYLKGMILKRYLAKYCVTAGWLAVWKIACRYLRVPRGVMANW